MAANIKATLQLDTKDAQKGVKGVGTALKALATGAVAKGIFDVANGFQEIQNKLKAVTDTTAGTKQAFESVANIAKSTRSDLSSTADLYFRLSKSAENLGLTQGETARVTELFAKTLKNSGATATEASSAILQFGQAMASGKLAGDEFRSLNETNSDLMDRLAKAMGKPRGELKKLASEGKITAKVIANALLESGNDIDRSFGKTTTTLGESLIMVKNEFMILVGSLETQFGVFSGLANLISFISENLKALGLVLGVVFAVKTISNIIKMVKAIQALQIATKAQAIAQAALLALSGPAGWGLLAGAAVATTAAVVGLNAAFGDSDEALKDVIDNVDKEVGSTKELVKESEAVVEEKKKQKAAADELARITKRQAEEFKSQLSDLQTGSDEFQTQLDLNRAMLGVSDQQKAVLQEIADIESDRSDSLRDLNDLTTISTADRLQREEEINAEYDERIALTKEANNELLASGTFQQVLGFYNKLTQASADYRDELALINAQQMGSSSEELRNLSELISLYSKTEETLIRLNEAFFGAGAGGGAQSARAAELVQLGKMTQEEADSYNERLANFFKYEADMKAALEKFQQDREAIEEKGTDFGSGFANAFENFEKNIKDAATFGKNIFDTMTNGFSDAIVSFVETGKLSFKDLFKSLMVEIIKMQANKIFLALFSPAGMFGDLFAGLFDKGGLIPGGKFGIAGENGPELINGPARVTSTAATADILNRRDSRPTQVVYNINAIDSRSFETRLAENPEYLYNITQVGARRQPR